MGNKKWKEWFDGLKSGEKLPKKNQLIIILLIGILLLVIVIPVENPQEKSARKTEGQETLSASAGEAQAAGEYEEYLERKTAKLLQEVEGAGEVTVMVTLRSGGQKIIEKDQSSTSQTTEEEDSEGGTRSMKDQSSDKTSIYKQYSDGSSSPYVSKELSPEIEGVVVIAEGGDDAVVVKNITEAVQALFGVEAHKIKIMKRA